VVSTLDELTKALSSGLAEAGTNLSERQLAKETRECRDEIYADTLTHGGNIEDPFFNFTIIDSVAVFTIFDDPFEFYIFPCDERAVISKCESDFAMVDVESCRRYLRSHFGKDQADVSVPRSLAEAWMEQC
jgi:hypothetical protein